MEIERRDQLSVHVQSAQNYIVNFLTEQLYANGVFKAQDDV